MTTMESTAAAFLVTEPDAVRSAAPSATNTPLGSPRAKLLGLLQRSLGSIRVDKSGKQMYFVAEGCMHVRRVMPISGVVSATVAPEELYAARVKPLLAAMVEAERDVVVIAAGEHGTSRSAFIHGKTLNLELDGTKLLDRGLWGAALLAVDDLVEIARRDEYALSVSVSKVHLETVADALVSTSGLRLTFADSPKLRSQYARLLALSSAASLDVEESEGVFTAMDQVEFPITETKDFMHVVNCFAAINSGKAFLRLGNSKTSPFHYIISFELRRTGRKRRRLHLVELGDLDWTASEDNAKTFQASVQATCLVAQGVQRGDYAFAQARMRDSLLTRLVFSHVDLHRVDIAVLGFARFSQTLRMMEHLAVIQNARIRVVLHGPDGEGADAVDPELQAHMADIQDECDHLEAQYADLVAERELLHVRKKQSEEALSRLEQQRNTLQRIKLGMAQGGNNESSVDRERAASGSLETTTSAINISKDDQAKFQQKQNRLRCEQIEKEIVLLREDDARREHAAELQIRFLREETARCTARTQVLQKEYDDVRAKLAEQQRKFDADKAAMDHDAQAKILAMLDRNRREADAQNTEARLAVESELQRAATLEDLRGAKAEIRAEELRKITAALARTIDSESSAWNEERAVLEARLRETRERRAALTKELERRAHAFQKGVEDFERRRAHLEAFAERATKALCALVGSGRYAVPCEVPMATEANLRNAEWLRRRTDELREAIAKMFPQKHESPRRAAPAAPSPVKTPKDLRAKLTQEITRHNSMMLIVSASLDRITQKREQSQLNASRGTSATTRPTTAGTTRSPPPATQKQQ